MRHARIIHVASIIFLLMGVLVVPAAGAAASAPSEYDGNATCETFDLMKIHKADLDDGASATGVDPSGRVGWVVYGTEDGEAVDWTSTVPVAAVLVKGGNVGGNMYTYQGALSDTGLHTPTNPSGLWADVSHITFCADPPPQPEPATILLEKTTLPADDSASFGFTSSIAGFAPTLRHGETAGVDVEPGWHSITELATDGWELLSMECDGVDDFGADFDAATVSILVSEGSTATCRFTNGPVAEPEPGTLIIEKITDPYDPHPNFTFTTNVPGWSPVLSHGETSAMEVEPGTYTLTEDMTPRGSGTYETKYWHLTSLTCDDPDAVITIDDPEAGGSATVTVGAGETITCTFTNEQKCPFNAKLIVEKVTEPSGADETFAFTSDIYWRTADPFAPVLGDGESRWTWAQPGTYTITEEALEGWKVDSIVCDGTDADVDLASGSATVDLTGGETVTCTFTNVEKEDEPDPGTLIVRKIADPADNRTDFEFAWSGAMESFTLGHGEAASFEVTPGEYTVHETVTTGWILDDVACSDGDAVLSADGASVDIAAGETVTCTFTNSRVPDEPEPGKIVLMKVTDPPGTGGDFAFTSTVDGWAPELSDGESASIDVAPGEYTISEAAVEGWMKAHITCDDPAAGIDLDAGSVTMTVDEGETVTCTFTNTQFGTLWVGKSTIPYTDDVYFDFTSDVAGWPPDLHGGMSASTTVEPGAYTVTELPAEGWELTDLTCNVTDAVVDLANGTATVQVGPGEFVKCEFTNQPIPEPPLGAIGDYVWHDENKNGLQDAGEPGIEGVRVNVYRAGNDVLATPPITVPDRTLVATARTDSTGHYLIEDVPAGNYIVEFTGLPAGFRWTKAFAGDRSLDSDADLTTGRSPVMVIPAGFVDLTCDAGAYALQDVLPDTGADLQTPLAAGIGLLIAGAALLGVTRRRASD